VQTGSWLRAPIGGLLQKHLDGRTLANGRLRHQCIQPSRGNFVPLLNIEYVEKATGLSWVVSCGGTRAYAVRHAENLEEDSLELQAADSHFMMRRVESGLLLGGV
jgi:hypothetical protein